MLSSGKKRESLAGKLLLSSALVALSLAYGWWQQHDAGGSRLVMAPLPVAPKKSVPFAPVPATAPAAPAEQPATLDAETGSGAKVASNQTAAAPQKSAPKAAAQAVAPAAPEPLPQQNKDASPSLASAAPAATPQSILPIDGDDTQPFLVTGTPDPSAKSPVPAGAHLEDGDYVSSRHQFMWGDLRIKIFVRGGTIAGLQALQFPDHRSQSLYLSGLAIPKLESEVIKNQTAQVDAVSSATDTSIVFQDAVADAIIKATRG